MKASHLWGCDLKVPDLNNITRKCPRSPDWQIFYRIMASNCQKKKNVKFMQAEDRLKRKGSWMQCLALNQTQHKGHYWDIWQTWMGLCINGTSAPVRFLVLVVMLWWCVFDVGKTHSSMQERWDIRVTSDLLRILGMGGAVGEKKGILCSILITPV